MANKKVGRPRKIETPEKLMELFYEYKTERGLIKYEDKPAKRRLLTIQGFTIFLYEKEIISSIHKYWYDLPDEFSDTKKSIESLIEEHWTQATADGDISTTFGIFYGKNKFGYADKVETKNINANMNTEVELTEEQRKVLEAVIQNE